VDAGGVEEVDGEIADIARRDVKVDVQFRVMTILMMG